MKQCHQMFYFSKCLIQRFYVVLNLVRGNTTGLQVDGSI